MDDTKQNQRNDFSKELLEKINSFLHERKSFKYHKDINKEELIEELFTYQAEIEAQNDALNASLMQVEQLDKERDKLFQSTPIAIILLDKNLFFYQLNEQARKMFEYQNIGAHTRMFNFIPKENYADFLNFTMHLSEDSTGELETFINILSTKRIRVKLMGTLLKSVIEPNLFYYQIAIQDITDYRELQEKLERRVIEEMEKVKELEAENAAKNLLHNQSQLLSNVAHHWRNPLNIVSLYLQALEERLKDLGETEMLDNLKKAMEQLEILSSIIGMFSTLSRPDEHVKEFDLVTLLKKVHNLIEMRRDAEDIECICAPLPKSIIMFGYPNALSHIVLSLMVNGLESIARKRKEDRAYKGAIGFSVEGKDDVVELRIYDNGEGIDEEIQEKMFQPYSSHSKLQSNTGLSLYHARMIVESYMQGTINIYNREGGGAEVVCRLPLRSLDVGKGYI